MGWQLQTRPTPSARVRFNRRLNNLRNEQDSLDEVTKVTISRLPFKVIVDGEPLEGQRVDHRDFGGKRRVEQVSAAQPLPLGDDPYHLGVGGEVDRRYVRGGSISMGAGRDELDDIAEGQLHDDLVAKFGASSPPLTHADANEQSSRKPVGPPWRP